MCARSLKEASSCGGKQDLAMLFVVGEKEMGLTCRGILALGPACTALGNCHTDTDFTFFASRDVVYNVEKGNPTFK